MLKIRRLLLAISVGSALACTARAQPVVQDLQSPADQTSTQYWNSQRMQNAKPMEPAKSGVAVSPSAASPRSAPATNGAPPARGEGSPPSVPSSDVPKALKLAPTLTPQQMQQQHGTTAQPNGGNSPDAQSQFGLAFTTSQVSPAVLETYYPYSTAGKLFFTEQGVGDFVCSASVLRPNIVVTAGHCVAHPSTVAAERHYYSNWLFVPAYNNGSAPYGQWVPSAVGTTGEWIGGDGSVPNAQDVGMLVMQEQSISTTVYRVGDLVGWLGYSTQSLAGNQVTMLGYPCNLDNCAIMERTDSGNSTNGGNNTEIYGSAAGGGASGGPWVQDFGVDPVSTGAGNQTWPLGLNYLVAVTSYGPSGTQGYLGASVLNNSFLNLLSAVCSLSARNC